MHPLRTLQRQCAWMFDGNPAGLKTLEPCLPHPGTIPYLGLLLVVQAVTVNIKEKETDEYNNTGRMMTFYKDFQSWILVAEVEI